MFFVKPLLVWVTFLVHKLLPPWNQRTSSSCFGGKISLVPSCSCQCYTSHTSLAGQPPKAGVLQLLVLARQVLAAAVCAGLVTEVGA
jgi:hypothetical protein